ncbi:hypothetical protein [Lacicoccus qingdaonensis]|uniref:Uncharacterized protein n=1 Tax=Lacicoccus qingdaonensis TaxID=576118 RepID=A0A1G9JG80_9BACL|nr:hypothetical protein [Salinicoccus qingdaonensis]SDL36587.1 hypothetical protein SAMN05216216_1504 [Salinicoccus qingdaonensis]
MKKIVASQNIQAFVDGQKVDLDRYDFEEQSALSTKDVSVVIDFENEEITGDCIAYGGWFELSVDKCLEYIQSIEKPIRNFDDILEKCLA